MVSSSNSDFDFTATLQQVSTSQDYLTLDKAGRFAVISSKQEKKLNTQSIRRIAAQKFEEVSKDTSLSNVQKAAKLKALSQALRLYGKRVTKSKKWYLQFLACLGIKSKQEKKISRLAKHAFQHSKKWLRLKTPKNYIHQIPRDELIPDSAKQAEIEASVKSTDNLNEQTKNDINMFLTIFAFQILQKTKKNLSIEGGLNQSFAVSMFTRDLQNFALETEGEEHTKSVKVRDQLLKSYTHSCAINRDHLKLRAKQIKRPNQKVHFAQLQPKLFQTEVIKSIVQSISELPKDNKTSFTLPGGYAGKGLLGHGVFYQIKRMSNGSYTFVIINTGSECPTFSWAMRRELLKRVKLKKKELIKLENEKHQLLQQVSQNKCSIESVKEWMSKAEQIGVDIRKIERKLNKLSVILKHPNQYTAEVIYDDLTLENLSLDFFRQLLNFLIKGEDSMRVVNTYIASKLYSPFPRNKSFGRFYLTQRWGSCAVKSASKWVRKELGYVLYAKFKVFQTEQRLKEIEKVSAEDVQAIEDFRVNGKKLKGQQLLDLFKKEGQITLAQRKRKLAKLLGK